MPPSNRPFMGAIPYGDAANSGVTFRVWAPFATAMGFAGIRPAPFEMSTAIIASDDRYRDMAAVAAVLTLFYPFSGLVNIGPYSAVILSQE